MKLFISEQAIPELSAAEPSSLKRPMMFTRFERFWHWTQAALIMVLLVTGFDVHGTYNLMWFSKAAQLHNYAAYALIALWVLAIFWHFTTGQWRQYLPTSKQLGAVIHYYLVGTFTGAEHPYRATTAAKHNPLQRLAYLWFKLMISPLIWASGLLYLFYGQRQELGFAAIPLEYIALTHTAAAFMMLVFLIAHVYMGTMGKTVLSLFKPMITGYEPAETKETEIRSATEFTEDTEKLS